MPRNHYYDRSRAKSAPTVKYKKVQTMTPFEKKLITWGNRKYELQGVKGILLEGEKLLNEALSINYPLHTVWVTEEFANRNTGMISQLQQTEAELKPVNNRTLREISELESPQGIVAVGPQPNFSFVKPSSPFSLIVALPKIQNPTNLGGVIRTADYFGVDELWLGQESADPYKPKVVRGSMGSIFRLPIVRSPSIGNRLKEFKDSGAIILAAVAHGENIAPDIPTTGPRILLIGEESKGLKSDMVALASRSLKIPGSGRSESLNLATATGILIYLATTGRMESV
jgi:TrmH family RNA methyltransferase